MTQHVWNMIQWARRSRLLATWQAAVRRSLARLRKRFAKDFWPTLTGKRKRKHSYAPQIEILEVRMMPSTITVTTMSDAVSHTGISLRDAIGTANTDAAGGTSDTIQFSSSLSGTITLTQGVLTLSGAGSGTISIDGGGQITVNGNSASQDFSVSSGVTATISNLTISGGSTSGNGAGIYNDGALTINNSNLSSNTSTNTATPLIIAVGGGGIYNDSSGVLAVNYTSFSNNSAYDGCGIYNHGSLTVCDSNFSGSASATDYAGGIFSDSTATITDSTFSRNGSDEYGGAIVDMGDTMTLNGCTLSANTAYVGGGGIMDTGRMTLNNCTIANNSSSGAAGGIWSADESLTINNCTITGNTASGGPDPIGGGILAGGNEQTITNSNISNNYATYGGGGIYGDGVNETISNSTLFGNSAGTFGGGIYTSGLNCFATLTHVTLSGNSAPTAGGVYNALASNSSTLTVLDTIVAGNTASTDTDVDGTVTGNYDLVGDGTGMTGISNGSNGNKIGTSGSPINPGLGSLQNNGGPTYTMALSSTSTATGAGGAITSLTAAAGSGDTTIYVGNTAAIASTSGQYYIFIDSEEIEVTAVNVSTGALTVDRGVGGTTAATHASAANVYLATDQRGFGRQLPIDMGAYAYGMSTLSGQQTSDDPTNAYTVGLGETMILPGSGTLMVSQPLAFDLASGTGGITPSLVYNSSTVKSQPVIQLQVGTPAGGTVPAYILVDLVWDGTDEGWTTFTPSGSATAGMTYLLDVRPPAVTQSNVYDWTANVRLEYTGSSVAGYVSGTAVVNARDNSPYGAGWGIAGLDQLVMTCGCNGAGAGVVWLYGTGQTRYFTPVTPGSNTYSNPEDFGTLVATSANVFTYTLAGSTYTFTKNASTGFFDLTKIVDPHTFTTSYAYNSSDGLTQVSNYDGATANLSYSTGNVTISEPGGRTVTLSLDGSNHLTKITDAAGFTRAMSYDGDGHLTSDSWDPYSSSLTYSGGLLTSVAVGGESFTLTSAVGQDTTLSPAAVSTGNGGLATLADSLGNTTTYGLDARDRLIYKQDALGYSQTWQLNSAGTFTLHIDANGNTATMGYDTSGNVSSFTTPNGEQDTFSDNSLDEVTGETILIKTGTTISTTMKYGSSGDLTSVVDFTGSTTNNSWNNGLMTTTVNPLGGTTTYSYNSNRQLTQLVNPDNETTAYGYDSAGNRTSTRDALGNYSYAYFDGDGNLTKTVDADGNTSLTSYDAAGLVTSMQSPNGGQAVTKYDGAGNVTVSTDLAGNTTSIGYDGAGRATETTSPNGGVVSTSYDADGRATLVTNALGGNTDNYYDGNGNLTKTISPLGGTTLNQYDKDNHLTQTVNPVGGTATTFYDKSGRVTAQVDYDGNTTLTTYDGMGRVLTVTNPLGGVTSSTYDADGNLTSTVTPISGLTSNSYDSNDIMTKSVNPLGGTTSYSYDLDNRATKIVNPLGGTTTQAYDPNGNITSSTDPMGIVTSTSFDPDGNVTKTVTPNGTTLTSYDYDDRPTSVTDPVSGVTTTAYDGDGNVTKTGNAGTGTTTMYYDLGDNLTKSVDGDGNTTLTSYDTSSDLTLYVDPSGNGTTYQYDLAGRQTAMFDPLGHTATTAYDVNGNPTLTVDQNGRSAVMTYDGMGNVKTQNWYTAGGTLADSQTFTYNWSGMVATAKNNNGSYSFGYDSNGDVAAALEPNGASMAMSYDKAGNRTKVTDSFGGTQISVYDLDSRLTTLTYNGQSQSLSETLTYFNGGQVNTATMYSGTTKMAMVTDGVASNGNVTSIADNFPNGSAIANYSYGYDSNGRMTLAVVNGTTTSYSYDSASQLTGAGSTAYSYDADGDPNSSGDATATDNRLTAYVDPTTGDTWSYQYDNVGNRTQSVNSSTTTTWNYSYDNANHQTSATETTVSGTTVMNYKYDVFGNQIEEDVIQGGTTAVTKYAVDGWNPANQGGEGLAVFSVWAVLNSNNTLQSRQLYSVGTAAGTEQTPLARIDQSGASDPSGVYWTLIDVHGSVGYVLGNTQNAAALSIINYNVFGEVLSFGGSAAVPSAYVGIIGWDGYRFDLWTFQNFAGARVYDPISQDWMEKDPLGFSAGDPNLYRYAGNSPLDATDPSGEFVSFLVTLGFAAWDTYQWQNGNINNDEYSIRMGINIGCLIADAMTGGFGGGLVVRGGAVAVRAGIARAGIFAGVNAGARAGVLVAQQGMPNFNFAGANGNQGNNANPPAADAPVANWPFQRDPTIAEMQAEGGRCKEWAEQIQTAIGGVLMHIRPKPAARGLPQPQFIGPVHTRAGQVISTEFREHWAVRMGNTVYDRITGARGMPIDEYKKLFSWAADLLF